MSTWDQHVRAQRMAFEHQPTQPWHRHLMGPASLEALLKPGTCTWTHVGAFSRYRVGCRDATIEDMHPGYRFCSYCGLPIKEKKS